LGSAQAPQLEAVRRPTDAHAMLEHEMKTSRALLYTVFVVLLGSLITGCIPDPRLILMESPTPRSCSLDAILTRTQPSASASPDTSSRQSTVAWLVHHDSEYGYSFEYPAMYERSSYSECEVHVTNRRISLGQEVYIGTSAAIFIRQPEYNEWEQEACLLALDLTSDAYDFSISKTTFAGEDAVSVLYNADWNPEGSAIMFEHDGLLFTISNIANPKCDLKGTTITATLVYDHLLSSFQFTRD